jgi:hypothetical protein
MNVILLGMEEQNGYSKLFIDLTSLEVEPDNNTVDNPFMYLANYMATRGISSAQLEFSQSLSNQSSLQLKTDQAYECFLLEITHLEDEKTEYLNSIINFLYQTYKDSTDSEKLIMSCIRQLFTKICQSHLNIYIDNNNRNRLSKWHSLKEPIKSFTLKKVPEDRWFQNRIWYQMRNHYLYELISRDTPYSSFKALFEGKYIENKINWTDNKSSLIYFIKSLISSKVIINPRNKHWEIVSEFFLINGESIEQAELLNQKTTRNKEKRELIDDVIGLLVNY